MRLKITQDRKFRSRYSRVSTKKGNILMTRLALSKSLQPCGTNTPSGQVRGASHLTCPTMQGKLTLDEVQNSKLILKPSSSKTLKLHISFKKHNLYEIIPFYH